MRKTRQGGIRRFIALWVGAVLLSFGLLVCGLLYAIPRLNAKTERIFSDSQSLQTDQLFELAILAQSREDLLWRSTARLSHQQTKALWVSEADNYLATLQQQADPSDAALVADITAAYQPVHRLAFTPQQDSRTMQTVIDQLLALLHRYRDRDSQQMEATLRASSVLDGIISRWIIGLTFLASALLLSGSLLLWRRLFTPVLNLASAVQSFGSGNLRAQVPVLRDDEMGDLCRTFNAMSKAMSEREKERLQFVATLAHDLRNPLVVIGGGANLLKNKDFRLSAEERVEWLGNIISNTHKLEDMIGDLMDGVQAETGQLAFDMKPLDLAGLAREITEEYSVTTQTHLIRYSDDGTVPINGDRKRLERVLMNLISNAVKYSPRGREVEVKLQKRGAHGIMTVRDEGKGIAPEDLSKLFQPFARLERTKKMAAGTGLGLSSVKKIIEGHDGTIAIQSTLEVGTVVEVCLPLSQATETIPR